MTNALAHYQQASTQDSTSTGTQARYNNLVYLVYNEVYLDLHQDDFTGLECRACHQCLNDFFLL